MTQLNSTANAYLKTKVLSATPEQLRLMLLDGALKFMRQGRDGIVEKNYEASFSGFSQARAIVMELLSSIRPEVDPDLCAKVTGLYTFLYLHIVEAGHERSIPKAEKVIELLEYEKETWVLLMEKLEKERSDLAAAAATAAAAAPTPPAGGANRLTANRVRVSMQA